jgi:hypothetical protein
MWWTIFVQKFFVYGCLGILIEFFFTSVFSLIEKNWKATGYSYIWMVPIYGVTATALEGVSSALPWPFWLKAFVYVPIIYGIEALSGWCLKLLTRQIQERWGGHGGDTIPWDYGKSRWTPMGLINLKYAFFWLVLAMAFDPISVYLRKALNFLAKME